MRRQELSFLVTGSSICRHRCVEELSSFAARARQDRSTCSEEDFRSVMSGCTGWSAAKSISTMTRSPSSLSADQSQTISTSSKPSDTSHQSGHSPSDRSADASSFHPQACGFVESCFAPSHKLHRLYDEYLPLPVSGGLEVVALGHAATPKWPKGGGTWRLRPEA